MVIPTPEAWRSRVSMLSAACLLGAGICLTGCGPTEETFEDEQWEAAPTPPSAETPVVPPATDTPPASTATTVVSPASAMALRADSLMKSNVTLQGQIEALTAENQMLRARVNDLEASVRAAQMAAPAPAATASRSYVNPSSDLRGAYSDALDQFMNRNYQGAIEQFEGILQANPNMDLSDNCTYWIGESYYALKNYGEAMRQFDRVLAYPSSGKKPYAQYMIGNSQLALGNRSAARDAFDAVVSSYPASPLVSKAQAKLARLN